MIRKLTFIMILAALGLSAGPASALFDDTVINPRARAMGEASVSVTDGQSIPPIRHFRPWSVLATVSATANFSSSGAYFRESIESFRSRR